MKSQISRRTALAQITGSAVAVSGAVPMSALALGGQPIPDQKTAGQVEGVFDLYLSNGRPLAMVTSGDSLPVPVLFDTGSSGNMVDTSVAKLWNLEKIENHQSFITDATGTTIEAYAANIPGMRLSNLPISQSRVDIYDYRVVDEAGILGPDLFNGNAVYMNFPKKTVYVRDAFQASADIINTRKYTPENGGGLPMMDISVDGMNTMAGLIDSGKNGALQFPENMIDMLPLVAPPTEVGTATTAFKTVPVLGAQIDADVTIGTVTLERPEVIFHGDTRKIGMPVLQSQRIWLEPHKQRGWVAKETALSEELADIFQGNYGERKIWRDGKTLIYQKKGRPEYRLIYLGGDHFLFDGSDSDTELIFRRNSKGGITGFTLLGASVRPFEVAAA